jgi:hypothetical protein
VCVAFAAAHPEATLFASLARCLQDALLVVPSIIVPEGFTIRINPQNSDSVTIATAKARKSLYDPRPAKTP